MPLAGPAEDAGLPAPAYARTTTHPSMYDLTSSAQLQLSYLAPAVFAAPAVAALWEADFDGAAITLRQSVYEGLGAEEEEARGAKRHSSTQSDRRSGAGSSSSSSSSSSIGGVGGGGGSGGVDWRQRAAAKATGARAGTATANVLHLEEAAAAARTAYVQLVIERAPAPRCTLRIEVRVFVHGVPSETPMAPFCGFVAPSEAPMAPFFSVCCTPQFLWRSK